MVYSKFCLFSVKYVGFFALWLGTFLIMKDWWWLLPRKDMSDLSLALQGLARCVLNIAIPVLVYVTIFYVHLAVLTKAGPHDSVMTSAFQASLEVSKIYFILTFFLYVYRSFTLEAPCVFI